MSIKSQDRIEALTRNLEVSNVIRLKDAADLLGVSEMTVRRDVANCEKYFHIYGGVHHAQVASSRWPWIHLGP